MSQLKQPQPIDADDPGLTAFALGELEGADAARYAEAVASSAELQAVIADIQAEARILSNELRLEPTIAVLAECRAEIVAQASNPPAVSMPRQKRFLGLSPRAAAVTAASVLLIPGAWYAFQAAFPHLPRGPMFAKEETASREYYRNDHVQYSSADAAPKLSRYPSASSTPGDTTQTTTAPAEHLATVADLDLSGVDAERRPVTFSVGSAVTVNRAEGMTSPAKNGKPGLVPAEHDSLQIEVALKSESEEGELRTSSRTGQDPKSQRGRSNAGNPTNSRTNEVTVESAPGDLIARGDTNKVDGLVTKFSVTEGQGVPVKGSTTATAPAQPAGTSPAKKPQLLDLSKPESLEESLRSKLHSTPTTGKPVGESKPSSGPTTALGLAITPVPGLQFLDERKLDRFDKGRVLALAELERLAKVPVQDLTPEDAVRLKQLHRLRTWSDDPTSNEAYNPIYENAFITPAEQQLSTFSIDVDTASYSNLRRFLQNGQLPPPDAVRIEELVNYFAYQYPQPQDGRPFSVQTDIAACPWQPSHQLVRIGLKGKEIPKEQRSPTNLVFLVDVSGSMSPANKLPLVRQSLTTLVNQLDERDKIAIVTYAGEAGVRLPSTSVAQRQTILNAIAGLGAGGSTNGAAGINTAYDIAAQEFLDKGTNRVILCTDGDFNVGVTSDDALVQMIQTRAKGGVFLSIYGFGMGNLKDAKLEQLADKGNGQYGYIDDRQEADKVFIHELMGTLVTIAKDVKIQIDFNKEVVASYRLVGYENRVLAAEDFHDDKKDAGEIGSGHTVTALYEIVPTKDLKVNDQTRWLTVKLRYKQPEAATSVLFEDPLTGPAGQLKLAPSDFQFAAGVAACGMLLRHSQYAGQANWGLVKELAQSGLSYDPHGHRRGFLSLVAQAESLMGQLRPASPPAPDSTVRGKYKSLLRKLNAPEDAEKYGQFNDYGYSDTKSYAGSDNLPAGYWVYITPHWYIWAETTQPSENKR